MSIYKNVEWSQLDDSWCVAVEVGDYHHYEAGFPSERAAEDAAGLHITIANLLSVIRVSKRRK